MVRQRHRRQKNSEMKKRDPAHPIPNRSGYNFLPENLIEGDVGLILPPSEMGITTIGGSKSMKNLPLLTCSSPLPSLKRRFIRKKRWSSSEIEEGNKDKGLDLGMPLGVEMEDENYGNEMKPNEELVSGENKIGKWG
ncbi:hypothetical protein LXL04_026756 [Taraxacum kok-saghyz]